jgi:putative transposase
MTTGADHPIRKSIRLAPDSYKQCRAYFVTVCTHEKQCLLSTIDGQSTVLTKYGEIVRSAWLDLPNRFAGLVLDEYILMPNHLHGVLCFVGAGLARPSSATKPANELFLPNVMRVFKSVSTVKINRAFLTPGFVLWQRSYFDHIIRDAEDHDNHRSYILENPARWAAKQPAFRRDSVLE